MQSSGTGKENLECSRTQVESSDVVEGWETQNNQSQRNTLPYLMQVTMSPYLLLELVMKGSITTVLKKQ